MAYNAQNAIVQESLPAGLLVQAVIVAVNDGQVKDFLSDEVQKKWVNPDQTAIEVVAECDHHGTKYRDTRIFPYNNDADGNVLYGERSNIGKFAKYYKKLPEVGDQIQMKTNADGYFKMVID